MAAYGGMERHVCALAEEATKRGHHVRFLTTSNSLNDDARHQLSGYGVDFRELPAKRETAGPARKAFWLWSQTLRARSRRWDLIYTNGQSALSSIVWRATRPGTRIVHHHHTAADAGEQQTWAPGFWRVLQRAPEIVACSEATRANIEQATHRNHVRFLPYFTTSPVTRDQVTEKSYAPGQPLAFGFVGRLIATKGVGLICEASRRPELTGITWHLYGASADYSAGYFASYPNVKYHGPYRDLRHYAEILGGLDALVLFSLHNEGMPLSLIEATAGGLPWAATDRGGTRELALIPCNCEVIPHPATPETVVAQTVALAQRIRSGTTSRVAQRRVYDQHFAPEVVVRKWFGYFEAALPAPSS